MDNIQQSASRYVFMALSLYETVEGCTNCYNQVDREDQLEESFTPYDNSWLEWKSIFKFPINKISKCILCESLLLAD
jgi:hypothetical protein